MTKTYPDIRFVLAHAGGAVPYLAGRVGITAAMAANLRGTAPVVADARGKLMSISAKVKEKMPQQLDYYLRLKKNVLPEGPDHFLRGFYYDTALSASPHCFSSLLTVTDCTPILFGTDYVFATAAAVAATIAGIHDYRPFTAPDIRAIEQEAALTLLPTLR